MIEAHASAIVRAPAEKVWNLMSDLGAMSQWNARILNVAWQPPTAVGTTAVITAKGLLKATSTIVVKEWEPDRTFAFEARLASMKIRMTCTVEPLEGGTTNLTRSAQADARGLLRLLSPLISYRMNKALSEQLANAKRLVERESGPGM